MHPFNLCQSLVQGVVKSQRDLSNFPTVVACCLVAVLIGSAQPCAYKADRKCDGWHYADKQQKLKQP